jgi:hypothetical protein
MKEELEVWKDIPGYEGLYQVSNLGNVKSLPREWVAGNGGVRKHNGKILKGGGHGGYRTVGLSNSVRKKTFHVHKLVAMAFLNHKSCGYELVVHHKNDNPSDNRVENLEITTQRDNVYKTQGKYSSKYKGVYWAEDRNKWRARIFINGKDKCLGQFECELEASKVYQKALKELL